MAALSSSVLARCLDPYNSMHVAGYVFIVLGTLNFAISGNIFTDRMKICLRDFADRAES